VPFIFVASRPIHYELPQDKFVIIVSFLASEVFVPFNVWKGLKVEKVCVLNKKEQKTYNKDETMQDLSEICHSVVFIDNNVIVRIFVFDEISSHHCEQIEEISRGIYVTRGLVKRDNFQKSDRMVMCRWRYDLGKEVMILMLLEG